MMIIDPFRAHNSLNDGLVLHWGFEEDSGTTAVDFSPNGYDGLITGATINQPGVIGTAYLFNGTTDLVSTSAAALMASLTAINTFSISFWANDTSFSNYDSAVSFGENDSNDAVSLYPYNDIGGGGFSVWSDGTDIITGAGSHLADGSYNHFVYVQTDATTHEVFVNGVSVGTSSTSKTTAATVDAFEVGRYVGNAEWFGGHIDEVRLYLRVLTDAEIVNLSLMQ